MAERFDPAAPDRHAVNPREAARADRDIHAKLEVGLMIVFRHPIPSARRSRHRQNRMATWKARRCGTRCWLCSGRIGQRRECGSSPMDDEFNHAANDSPRSGSSKQVTPAVWAAIVVAIAAMVIWFAMK
jgi:hypothetical protein